MRHALLLVLVAASPVAAQEEMRVDFERVPETWTVQSAETVAGREGNALFVGPGAEISMPTPEALTRSFAVEVWVRHEEALSDLRFEELVYLYHDTEDLKNRICLKKRIGTDEILFGMSDSGPGKGAEFAGDWYAMTSGPLAWEAGSWHHLRIVANREAGRAELWIDGEQVASAQGTQFPQQLGTLWLGSWSGRSQVQAAFDDLSVEVVEE
jgi:hypothetical protein